jgi:nifR3 family TIM-barrel protein
MPPDDLSRLLNRPLAIGNRRISSRLVLAPMTFLGNVAFRELVANFGGCGLLFSEMCSAGRIPHEDRNHSCYFRWRDQELSSLVCQIVGEEPEAMARAARIIEQNGFFGVDINFGCSAASICSRRCGAALLKTPERAAAIVAAVRRAVSIPLFVKFRTGWRDNPVPAVALAKMFEHAGADALTFHPRVAPDRRSRPPRWEYIGRIKEAVKIPVIGNGNVFSREDCLKMMCTTGCDAVALGRLAVAKPWVFASWGGGYLPGPRIHRQVATDLLELLGRHFEPQQAMRRYKRFALYFAAVFRFGHSLYTRVQNAASFAQIREVIDDFFRCSPELTTGPNMNFFI